jgi:hypothetical protein
VDQSPPPGTAGIKQAFPIGIEFRRLRANEVVLEPISRTLVKDLPIWSFERGWFSASYGPFRRFTGGDPEVEKRLRSTPQVGRHLTLFYEGAALTEVRAWLKDLKLRQLGGGGDGGFLNRLIKFINHPDFLPYQMKLKEITAEAIQFEDPNGALVPLGELSDGYRSLLSLTLDVIRQLAIAYEGEDIFSADATEVSVPGVVLVDEIDVHLHPTWQRRVGWWFREHFPHVQFIVSSHSPLVCHPAEVGSVWRLPRPGMEERGERVTGEEMERLIYGNILDAYGTGMFGEGVTRSDESNQKLDRLAELNVRDLQDGLSEAEKREREHLRDILPTSAYAVEGSAAAGNGVASNGRRNPKGRRGQSKRKRKK